MFADVAGPAVDKIIRDIESTYIADKVAELGLEQVLADCTARAGETCVDAMDAAIVQWAYFKQRMPTSYGIYDEDVLYAIGHTFPFCLPFPP